MLLVLRMLTNQTIKIPLQLFPFPKCTFQQGNGAFSNPVPLKIRVLDPGGVLQGRTGLITMGDNKENVNVGDDPGQNILTPPVPNPAETLTNKVISHFLTHWDTFKKNCLKEVTSLDVLLNDPAHGLVKKVDTLETGFTDLSQRVGTLESNRAPSGAALDPALAARVKSLEKKFNTLAEIKADGEVILKHPDIEDIKEDLHMVKEDIETITGFMHLMSKEVKSPQHKTNLNSAKLMRNTLIFGGVCMRDEESPLDAITAFVNNFLQLFPSDDDILEAEALGNGYTKWVEKKGMEITFPPAYQSQMLRSFCK